MSGTILASFHVPLRKKTTHDQPVEDGSNLNNGKFEDPLPNVCGIHTKQDEWYSLKVDQDTDVVALTETPERVQQEFQIKRYSLECNLFPASYNVFNTDHTYSSFIKCRGGSAIVFKSDLKCTRRSYLESFPKTVRLRFLTWVLRVC